MNLNNSLLKDLVTEYSELRPQTYFKSSLNALARAMQDIVLTDEGQYLVIANFQQEKYFRSSERRFRHMAAKSDQVYILGVPDTDSKFAVGNSYETIPLAATDTLARERYLVIIGLKYSACLTVREKQVSPNSEQVNSIADRGTRYEGIWSFDRTIAYSAADWLLSKINYLRPELEAKTERARRLFVTKRRKGERLQTWDKRIDLGTFTQSLVTYLQSGQYKLMRAYKAIATAQRKESLSNKIAAAQRVSLDPNEIITTTVRELGLLFPNCRCLLYPIATEDTEIIIKYEAVSGALKSLAGETWAIGDNPLFITAQAQRSTLVIDDVASNPYLIQNSTLKDKIKRAEIHSWLMVSIRDRGKLLGMVELHYGKGESFKWQPEDIALVEAVASSTGTALTQAQAYDNLLYLNTQLEAVERVQSNLIAIVGHELRTPLTTIRVCLESLATEPHIPSEIKDSLLDTALADTERLAQLIQNFLTLSKLEEGRAYQNIEPLTIDYALDLALRQIKTTARIENLPEIEIQLEPELPTVLADADGAIDVFNKLLDNACKFTPAEGKIIVTSNVLETETENQLEIIISDTGRGIEPEQLETIFNRFAQSENYLRRTVSGAGLGLVICRQIVESMGGQIWAASEGADRGSQFHFTLPIEP